MMEVSISIRGICIYMLVCIFVPSNDPEKSRQDMFVADDVDVWVYAIHICLLQMTLMFGCMLFTYVCCR